MKTITRLFLLLALSFLLTPSYAVKPAPVPQKEALETKIEKSNADWEKMSRKEKRAEKKTMRKKLKTMLKSARKNASDTDLLLLIIIAILLPPLAMALYDGISNRFWISLLLTLLFYVPGLIYTLVVILGDN